MAANRNFANKLWNAGRFVIGTLDNAPVSASAPPTWSLADSWIWARLRRVVRDVERLFTNHQYGEAGRQIYDFFWGEFADWYVEIAKLQMTEGGDRAYYTARTLVQVLDACLRLLHPFTPFVTEELWGHLKSAATEHSANFPPFNRTKQWEQALIVAAWPEPEADEGWEDQRIIEFTLLQDVVRTIRNLRAEKKIPAGKRIAAKIAAGDKFQTLQAQARTIAALASLDPAQVAISENLTEKISGSVSSVVAGVEIHLPLTGAVDVLLARERLQKELAEAEGQIKRLEGLLASDFSRKAPEHLVAKERDRLSVYQATAEKLREQLKRQLDNE